MRDAGGECESVRTPLKKATVKVEGVTAATQLLPATMAGARAAGRAAMTPRPPRFIRRMARYPFCCFLLWLAVPAGLTVLLIPRVALSDPLVAAFVMATANLLAAAYGLVELPTNGRDPATGEEVGHGELLQWLVAFELMSECEGFVGGTFHSHFTRLMYAWMCARRPRCPWLRLLFADSGDPLGEPYATCG